MLNATWEIVHRGRPAMTWGSWGQISGSATGTQVPEREVRRVLAEQSRQLFSQCGTGSVGAALAAVMLTVALWSVVSHMRLLIWVGTYLSLVSGRMVFLRVFLARPRSDEEALAWLPWLHLQIVLGGLFWGLAAFFLFPEASLLHQFILAGCIAGVSSAAVATFSPTKGFLPCLAVGLGPTAGSFLWSGGETNIAMAAAVTLYGAVLVGIGQRMHDTNAHSLALRFENADLVASLRDEKGRAEALNRELEAEIEVRKTADEALRRMHSELETRVDERSAQLRTSQEKMVALFKGIPVPSYIWQVHNDDFMLVNYNDAAVKMSQGLVCRLIGTAAKEAFKDRPDVLDDLHRVLRAEGPIEREMPSDPFDPSARRHLTVKYVFVPPDMVLVHAEDITAAREAERALRQSEGEYRALVEGSFDGIFIHTSGRIVFSNYRLQEMLGYRSGELDRLDIWALYHPDDRKSVLDREIDRLSGKEVPSKYEVRLLRKDGSWFPAELDARLGLFRGGPGVQVCVSDISERAQAERERLRLVTAIEQSAEIVMITDTDMRIVYLNHAFESTTGYGREEAMGGHCGRFMGAEEPAFCDKIRSVLREGKTWSGRLNSRRKDGSWYQEEATVSPIRDSSGEVVNYVGVKRDVTHETAMENQLRQAQKMQAIGTLAGGIAHDFNNVLYAIIGFSELALADAAPDGTLHNYLTEVLSAGERARHLVKQILTFCRQSETEKNRIEISPVVKEALKFLRASLPSTIEIRKQIDPDAGSILGDATQIHQVLMNLCTNAAQAMRDTGGILTVGLDCVDMDSSFVARHPELKPGPYTRIFVNDTGVGMTPETVERIFEPYFTTKAKGEGTGLGLAVVHGIVKDHAGAITVQSEPGIGTTVQVCFPRIETEAIPDTPAPEALPLGSERILLVDDEPSVIQMSRQTLERLGYRVTTVSSAEEALAVFRDDPDRVDLVISDMTMPKMTGKALAQELMAIRPDIPIILCTGFSELISEHEAEALGIRALVMKPILRNRIAETVRRVLDRQS
ncbi:MAG: PAS domain S-box protein [Thermodesulfobacteriota bacterium]